MKAPNGSGWQTYMGSAQRKAHYFHNDTTSLCRKRGFYTDELTPPNPDGAPGPDDCAECQRRLAKLAKTDG